MGRGIYALCQWLAIIIIARIGSQKGLGEFTYALAITSPIIIFSQLNLRAFMATDIKSQFDFSDYLTTRLFASSLAFFLIAVMVFIKEYSIYYCLLVLSVSIYKIVESISDLYYGVLQKNEEMSHISISLICHGIISLSSITISIYLFDSILYGCYSIIISWLILLYLYDRRNADVRWDKSSIQNWQRVNKVLKTCFPLGLVMGLVSLRPSVPIYFIEEYMGISQVGYYSAVAYFLVAGNLIISSLIQAAAPRLAYYYHHKQAKKALKFLVKLMVVGGGVGVIGIVFSVYLGGHILSIFYGKEFGAYKGLLFWIICAGGVGFFAQIMGLSLTVTRLFRYQLFSNLLGITSVIVFSYYLIPNYGLEGGAIALLTGNTFIFLFNTVFVLINRSVFYKSLI